LELGDIDNMCENLKVDLDFNNKVGGCPICKKKIETMPGPKQEDFTFLKVGEVASVVVHRECKERILEQKSFIVTLDRKIRTVKPL